MVISVISIHGRPPLESKRRHCLFRTSTWKQQLHDTEKPNSTWLWVITIPKMDGRIARHGRTARLVSLWGCSSGDTGHPQPYPGYINMKLSQRLVGFTVENNHLRMVPALVDRQWIEPLPITTLDRPYSFFRKLRWFQAGSKIGLL